MSLGIVINAPEGIVLAAESRVTLTAKPPGGSNPIHVNFDNATKLLSFAEPNDVIGAVTFGAGAIGLRTAQSFVPEFEASLPVDIPSDMELSASYRVEYNAAPSDLLQMLHVLVRSDELPFPDKDISPALQHMLKRKFESGEVESVDKGEFFNLLGRAVSGDDPSA